MSESQEIPESLCNREMMASILGVDPAAMPVLMSLGCPVTITGGSAPAQDTYQPQRVIAWIQRVREIAEKPTIVSAN